MAETILNFAKILDVLFISSGEVSREQVRQGLRRLGYADDEIERNFIPALLLRNEFDIAHVALTVPNAEQLDTLHRYTESAEGHFRELMSRLLEAAQSGTLDLPPIQAKGELDAKKAEILSRLRQSLALDSKDVT